MKRKIARYFQVLFVGLAFAAVHPAFSADSAEDTLAQLVTNPVMVKKIIARDNLLIQPIQQGLFGMLKVEKKEITFAELPFVLYYNASQVLGALGETAFGAIQLQIYQFSDNARLIHQVQGQIYWPDAKQQFGTPWGSFDYSTDSATVGADADRLARQLSPSSPDTLKLLQSVDQIYQDRTSKGDADTSFLHREYFGLSPEGAHMIVASEHSRYGSDDVWAGYELRLADNRPPLDNEKDFSKDYSQLGHVYARVKGGAYTPSGTYVITVYSKGKKLGDVTRVLWNALQLEGRKCLLYRQFDQKGKLVRESVNYPNGAVRYLLEQEPCRVTTWIENDEQVLRPEIFQGGCIVRKYDTLPEPEKFRLTAVLQTMGPLDTEGIVSHCLKVQQQIVDMIHQRNMVSMLTSPRAAAAVPAKHSEIPALQAAARRLIAREPVGEVVARWIPGYGKILANVNGVLKVIDVETGAEEVILEDARVSKANSTSMLEVAPDGRKALYDEDDYTMLVDLKTREKTDLLDVTHTKHNVGSGVMHEWVRPTYPHWSPDGKTILYTLFEKGFYTVPASGGASHLVLNDPRTLNAQWTPHGDVSAQAYVNKVQNVFVCDLNGKQVKWLAADADEFQWFPSGDRLAFLRKGRLFIKDLGSSKEIEVGDYNSPGTDWRSGDKNFSVSPDNRFIAYTYNTYAPSDEEGQTRRIDSEIRIYDVEAATTVKVTHAGKQWDVDPQWSPDRKKILCFQIKDDKENSRIPLILDLQKPAAVK